MIRYGKMKITRKQLRKLISEVIVINEGGYSFYSTTGTGDDFTVHDRWEDYKERPFYAEMFIEQGLDDQEMTINQSDFLMELNQGPEGLEKYRANVASIQLIISMLINGVNITG